MSGVGGGGFTMSKVAASLLSQIIKEEQKSLANHNSRLPNKTWTIEHNHTESFCACHYNSQLICHKSSLTFFDSYSAFD